MAFMLDKQELKPGLVIFRRSDVKHKQWYCRIKVPDVDRYKTISLETSDVNEARTKAFRNDVALHVKIEHNLPVFDRPFAEVAEEYADFQEQRAKAGEITEKRAETERGYINTQLNRYVGSFQISVVGEDRWKGYPIWRRANGKGRSETGRVSDWTIRSEMATFRAVMLFAAGKKYIPENSAMFRARLKLGKPRGEAFTPEEYTHLYTYARGWVKKGKNKKAKWERTVFYNFMLFMANTGLRPPEARNLLWRDVGEPRTGQDGRPFLPLRVRGKDKFRELVAPMTASTYLERVRAISKATKPDDPVFTTFAGKPAVSLYASLLDDLLSKTEANLLLSAAGKRRSTYSFRHTYATFRLMSGTDVYFLAKQMGTSVKMIEDYYGHITPSQNADAILQGIPGWEAAAEDDGETASGVKADAAKSKAKPRTQKKPEGKDLPAAGKASRSTRRR